MSLSRKDREGGKRKRRFAIDCIRNAFPETGVVYEAMNVAVNEAAVGAVDEAVNEAVNEAADEAEDGESNSRIKCPTGGG